MSFEETPLDRSSEDMDDPQGDDMGEQISREGAGAIGATTAEGLKSQPDGSVELQMQMPGLDIEFGLELIQQRAEQLEKLPSLGVEGQLPVGPLP